jgi:hypothetical protein
VEKDAPFRPLHHCARRQDATRRSLPPALLSLKVYDHDLCTATIQLRVSELVLPARLPREVSGHSSCQVLAFEEVVERRDGGRVAD